MIIRQTKMKIQSRYGKATHTVEHAGIKNNAYTETILASQQATVQPMA